MNENIDLIKILKDCPKGWQFWSPLFGEVKFDHIVFNRIEIECVGLHKIVEFDLTGKYLIEVSENNGVCFSSECILFPSKDQRDWSKFTAPWYKHEEKKETKRFDPKTLNVFDKVLARVYNGFWFADFVSVPGDDELCDIPCLVGSSNFNEVVPYNDETKHLLGTADEAPEYYQYVDEDDEWEVKYWKDND